MNIIQILENALLLVTFIMQLNTSLMDNIKHLRILIQLWYQNNFILFIIFFFLISF